MRGDGIKLATTIHRPAARVLDLTRLISRAGRVPTGVDRVELAYLKQFIREDVQAFGLVRSTLGYVLVDRVGLVALAARFTGEAPWGPADRLSWSARKKGKMVRRAESDLRRLALARCLPSRLGRMVSRRLPRGLDYYNVGHSNLTERTLWAMRHDLDAQIHVLIHDVIPLDFPQYQRVGTPETFRAKLKRVRAFADRIIYNSEDTRRRAKAHMAEWGALSSGVVAPLGVEPVTPDPRALPDNLDLEHPYFVTVGTIEPRKHHGLLLDVWDDWAAEAGSDGLPRLFICGGRGWNNDAVFRRLDALPDDSPVIELSGLSDAAIAALVQSAQALLFLSEAEGYGLPPIEAAMLGTPVICRDLPVYRETLGDIPVYVKETDRYLLRNIVQSLSQRPKVEQKKPSDPGFHPPSWDDHFRMVLTQARHSGPISGV